VKSLQSLDSVAERVEEAREAAHQVRDLDDLPALLGAAELAALLRIGLSRFYRLAKRGHFDFLKVKPQIGPKVYSGLLVARYLRGEAVYQPTFGRKRSA
jgi:hypothetical protein